MLTCCNSDDDEDEDGAAESAENGTDGEEAFDQYHAVWDIVRKHLM